jgi:hypothetical protein
MKYELARYVIHMGKVKAKVVPVHATTGYGRPRRTLHSVLDGGDWSTSRTGRFTLEKQPLFIK